jgi:hypothetical protein
VTGYKGFYYHFLKMKDGRRAGGCELSTVDSAFLLAGMLMAAVFFDAETPAEIEIRETANALFRRADWQWALYGVPCDANGWPTETVDDVTIVHGGTPENGFISYRYQGYDESLLMHVLGLGSSTFPLPPGCYPCVAEDLRLADAVRDRVSPQRPPVHPPAQSTAGSTSAESAMSSCGPRGSTISRTAGRAVRVQQGYARRIRRSSVGTGR